MKHFLQFYVKEDYLFFDTVPFTNFHNGLSCVWGLVEDEGSKFYWMESGSKEDPPITEGDLYVSCWTNVEFTMVHNWALKFPNLNFKMGGPLMYYDTHLENKIPNFNCLKGNAEDLLYNGNISWGLKIPEIDGPIGYSVTLLKNRGCWWGKCTYCCRNAIPIYRDYVDHVPIIDHPGHKYIWLYTCAITRKLMHKLYPTFPDRDDVTYASYIRGDQYSLDAYRDVLPKLKMNPKYLSWDLGIEFPGDKMLKHMNKGATTKNYLDFIELATKHGNMMHFNFILNWNNLTNLDVKQVSDFMHSLSDITDGSNITADIYPLFLMDDRPMFHGIDKKELVYQPQTKWRTLGEWDIVLYCYNITGKQKELNKKCEEMIEEFPFATMRNSISSYKTCE